MTKHFPDVKIPAAKKARNRRHQQGDPVLRQAPECRARHAQLRTQIALAIELVDAALRHNVAVGVVVFDAWSLAEAVVQVLARRRKAWSSRLKTNRRRETARLRRRDAHGWPLPLPGPPIAVAELGPLIPAEASRPVSVREPTTGCFTLAVRIPALGKVRIVVSVEHEQLTGRDSVLVTTRADWSATTRIGLYRQRWPTEISQPYYDSRASLSRAAA